jgi:pyruvate formate lyase activating enzyme
MAAETPRWSPGPVVPTRRWHRPEDDRIQCKEEFLIGRDRYDLTDWNLTAKGRCRKCGTVLSWVLEEWPGVWNGRRLPVKFGRSAA